MGITDNYDRVSVHAIHVRRDERQRTQVRDAEGKFLNDDGLLESIAARGVMTPLIVEDVPGFGLLLHAGERRLEASKELGLPDVPIRYIVDLTPAERLLVEWDENAKRSELPWRDLCTTLVALHEALCIENENWTVEKSIEVVNHSQLRYALRVCRDLDSPKIAHATSIRAAYNILLKLDERATANAMADVIESLSEGLGGGPVDMLEVLDRMAGDTPPAAVGASNAPAGTPGAADPTAPVRPANGPMSKPGPTAPLALPVLQADFIEWSATYSGPRFNFLHCDFPYGTNVFGGKMGGRGQHGTYDDNPEVYPRLIRALCANLDRLLTPSAHIMFWLSADADVVFETMEMFRALAPGLVFWPKPLIWFKTDNVGVVSDAARGPRHVYEAALMASREDRKILKPVGDAYGAPTDRSLHPSTKPEPVLKHFFSMFVDETTLLLDPTCGSGSALRAAEALGAKGVLGLERDPEHVKEANDAIKRFRVLRRMAS